MNDKVVKRDDFFDSLKFFLISIVILGHTIEISDSTRLGMALYNTIYSFHMPLFVFISGYFSRRYEDKNVFYRKTLRLVETYLIFQFVFSIPSVLSGSIITAIVRPWWILWYLFSLIIWRVVIQITPPSIYLNNRWLISIRLIVVLTLSAGFVPLSYEFSFQRTMTFLPFFAIGYICANIKEVDIKSILPSGIFSLLYFMMVFLAFYYLNRSYSAVLYGSMHYSSLSGLCGRIAQLILGCLGGLCFMGLVKNVKLPDYFNNIGANSLFFFVYHAPLILVFNKLISHYNIHMGLLMTVIICFLIILLLYALSHIHLFHFFLNPISSYYDKKNISNRRV